MFISISIITEKGLGEYFGYWSERVNAFFFFFGHAHNMWTVQGQGLNSPRAATKLDPPATRELLMLYLNISMLSVLLQGVSL